MPTLSTNVPILPGFMPSSLTGLPLYPVRGPGWSINVTSKWNNARQQAVGGKTTVIKYWTNPLWEWEWVYDVILDDPKNQNPMFTSPIPYTDYQILQGFYNSVSGGGAEFAFQPPDSVVGGTFTATAISCKSNVWTIYLNNNTIQAGLTMIASGLSPVSALNGQFLMVLQSTPSFIVVYFSHADVALTTLSGGTVFAGQQLAAPNASFYSEIIHTVGGYPTLPVATTPTTTNQVTESVQVIDLSSVVIVDGNGTIVTPSGNYTIYPADTIPSFQGLAIYFVHNNTPPILASFNYYYLCRFTEDTMDFENFMAMLWATKSFKFEQVRI